MTLLIDRSGTATRPDPSTFASWAGDQRVFISSAMGSLAPLRRSLADAIVDMGAQPVWFEAFGGRDDDAEVAYLGEVGASTLYLGILGREYGRIDVTRRLSATHAEYREAERLGIPVSVWVRGESDMLADQHNFLTEVRLFHTTGSFTEANDLTEGVRRRFEEMAAEATSPWTKLGGVIFRSREIVDDGNTIVVNTSVHDGEVVAALEAMRPRIRTANDLRLTWANRSAPVRVIEVQTTTTASRSSSVRLTLDRLDSTSNGSPLSMTASFNMGTATYSSDDLAVLDLRHMLFGEEKPRGLMSLGGSIRDFTGDLPAVATPTALYQAVFSLLTTEVLIESGRAIRVARAQVSPKGPEGRHVRLAWTGHTDRGGLPTTVSVEGVMRPQGI